MPRWFRAPEVSWCGAFISSRLIILFWLIIAWWTVWWNKLG
jgi:hypothetical protein